MGSIKDQRVDLNNNWPKKSLFPAEKYLIDKMKTCEVDIVFQPAKLKYSDDQDFHNMLSHYLEALDQLPLRPDIAFDCIWKALDAEFVRLQKVNGSKEGRFSLFYKHISKSDYTCNTYSKLTEVIPLQTCEFVAKRILENNIAYKNKPKNNDYQSFRKRTIDSLGQSLYDVFIGKYGVLWDSNKAKTQRDAGILIQKLLKGNKLKVETIEFQLSDQDRALFLTAVTMPQFRNERFHGLTTPPFRSSTATLKTYSHAYFIFHVAYAHLLEVFLYRDFKTIDIETTKQSINDNLNLFIKVFKNEIKK
ncbi:hypothetical protein [Pantoea coffeiphila]|uniref:Uncharacterized protein n=1 Tax=Pantoea coffeiphila TaxID=1465635 RepID=A0A2S9I831_9GAMM|nr:hypothetical protein [Pantoea coffeiphila]PRD13957.1 hypothetical protein CQW29_18290 [Pantoea coffeiphila]